MTSHRAPDPASSPAIHRFRVRVPGGPLNSASELRKRRPKIIGHNQGTTQF